MSSRLTGNQEAALRATARLACVAALAGCGSKAAPQPTATPSTPTVAEPPADALPSPFTSEEQKQCESTVKAAMAEREGRGPGLAPEVEACCRTLIADWDDARKDAPLGEWEHHWDCCEALNFDGPFCTPWGPPAPPAMRGEVS